MAPLSLFGERSLTLVAAAFGDRERAERVARNLQETPLLRRHVAVVAPDDPAADRKFEPEQRGIWHTLLRSHAILGVAGLAVGLLVAYGLVLAWPAAAHSPAFAALFIGTLGAFFGMLIAGLLTLRPDHGVVIRDMRARRDHGAWNVVVHPRNAALAQDACATLERAGGTVARSL